MVHLLAMSLPIGHSPAPGPAGKTDGNAAAQAGTGPAARPPRRGTGGPDPAREPHRPLPFTREEMWAAFVSCDGRYDGWFVVAVRSTGVFCRPTCTCRKPRPDRVEFFGSAETALAAGYRPCKRCLPELPGGPAEADRRFAAGVIRVMRARLGEPLSLADLAAAVAASPSVLARRFRAADGRTPMRALADLRADRAAALLADARLTVLEAGLAAGFRSPSAFVRAFRRRTGLDPAAWRRARRSPGVAAAASNSTRPGEDGARRPPRVGQTERTGPAPHL